MSAGSIQAILNDDKKLNQVVKAVFDQVDTDGSGKINKDELDKILEIICKDMGANPPSHEETMEVFNHLDTDKSGKIEFNEFKTLIKEVLKSMA